MKNNYKILIGLLLLFIVGTIYYFTQRAYNAFENLQKPIVNTINFPDNSEKLTVPSKDILTIFPVGNSTVYYETTDINGILKIDSNEFNELIKDQEKNIGKNKFTVVIKSAKNAKYKDMVDLLDKMSLFKITRYSILGITIEEENKIKNLKK